MISIPDIYAEHGFTEGFPESCCQGPGCDGSLAAPRAAKEAYIQPCRGIACGANSVVYGPVNGAKVEQAIECFDMCRSGGIASAGVTGVGTVEAPGPCGSGS